MSGATSGRLAAGGGTTERGWRGPWRYKCVIRPAQTCAACVCSVERCSASMGEEVSIGMESRTAPHIAKAQ
jgi:hypothetical protein